LDDKALASFQRVDLTDPLQLFFHFYASEDAVRKFIASTRARNTDDNVWLEYHTPGNIVETSSLDTAQEHGIGIRLLEAGADQRLDGFETMLPGVPIEALLKESLAYQYGLRLGYDRTGAVIDRWGAARKVVVEGLRSAVRRRDDTELSMVLERGVSQGETKIRTRSDAPSDIAIAEAGAAASFYKKGDLQNAEAHYRNALRYVASPAYYEALVGLGNIAVRQGRREQAQEFYERAVARNPYRVIAFHNLASLFLGTDAAKLRSVVERGLRFNPQDSLLAQFR
jgi:tetratricopeptide (TPR) repeat protein